MTDREHLSVSTTMVYYDGVFSTCPKPASGCGVTTRDVGSGKRMMSQPVRSFRGPVVDEMDLLGRESTASQHPDSR